MGKAFARKVFFACFVVLSAFVVAACGAASPGANQPSGAEKVATFRGGGVTQGQVEEAINLVAKQSGAGNVKPGSPQYEAAIPQVMPQLVQTEIAKAYAREHNITVSDKDVNAEIDKLKAQLAQRAQASGRNLSPDQALKAALSQAGVSETQLRQNIKDSLPVQKVQEKVVGNVRPTQKEVQAYYEQNKSAQFTTPEQRCVRHILFGPDQKQKAEDAYKQLKGGADFATLARKDSQDTGSAQKGGDLGCIGKGQTVEPFDKAVFGAKKGQLLGPVQTRFGYHIIKVYDIKPEKTVPLSEVEGEIRSQLTAQKQQEAFAKWLQKQEKERDVKYLPGYSPNTPAAQSTTAR